MDDVEVLVVVKVVVGVVVVDKVLTDDVEVLVDDEVEENVFVEKVKAVVVVIVEEK
jgi:hypothetical protein